MNVDGKILTTKPIKIEVVKGASSGTSSTSRGSSSSSGNYNQNPNTLKNLKVRIQLSKNMDFKAEQIVASNVL